MLFKSETTLNNDFGKDFAWIFFADRRNIQTLWTRFFEDLLKIQNPGKLIHSKIKLAKFNLCEN